MRIILLPKFICDFHLARLSLGGWCYCHGFPQGAWGWRLLFLIWGNFWAWPSWLLYSLGDVSSAVMPLTRSHVRLIMFRVPTGHLIDLCILLICRIYRTNIFIKVWNCLSHWIFSLIFLHVRLGGAVFVKIGISLSAPAAFYVWCTGGAPLILPWMACMERL